MNKYIIIINPCRTGLHYHTYFNKYGITTIAYLEDFLYPISKAQQSVDKIKFDIEYTELAELTNFIEKNFDSIINIIAGNEFGVELAEELARKYNFPVNKFATNIRRNKFCMQEQLQKMGLRNLKQQLITKDNYLSCNIFSSNTDYVLKPTAGMNSENVLFIKTEQLNYELENIKWRDAKYTMSNLPIIEYILQEYIPGNIQYSIDFAVIDGVYQLMNLLKYHKSIINNQFITHEVQLLDPWDNSHQDLVLYAKEVAKALGVVIGPIHLELKYNQHHQPVLIEIGARLLGGTGLFQLLNSCYNQNIVEANCLTYLNKKTTRQTKLLQHGIAILLINANSDAQLFNTENLMIALAIIKSTCIAKLEMCDLTTIIEPYKYTMCISIVNSNLEQLYADRDILINAGRKCFSKT
jgi:biotin carboxylase